MSKKSNLAQSIKLNIVGSNTFGRYPKMSNEQTYNMFISDNWLVPYAGYKKISTIAGEGKGRGLFSSSKLGKLILVIGQNVYSMDKNLSVNKIAELETYSGDVFIAENNASEIAFCDRKHIYIYNYATSSFRKAIIDFIPNYIDFHDTYFIAAVQDEASWRLSGNNDGLTWDAASKGLFETKADKVKAVVKVPGRSGQILVIGEIVTEVWTDIGAQLFPYQRSSSFNIDYGVANESTIASSDSFIVWLGINEKSGLAIFVTDGGTVKQISSDGINTKLNQLNFPEKSYGFLFRQDGHLFYQLTFSDKKDNFTLLYDFNTKQFYYLTDGYMNYHIAKKISYFNNSYYFVSENDGGIYEMSTDHTYYDGEEIPRIRICGTTRFPSGQPFIVSNITFVLEQGENKYNDDSRVDMSISRDGGVSFSSYSGMVMQPLGKRKNQYDEYGLGYLNEFTAQFRFWGKGRFVATDGLINVYR